MVRVLKLATLHYVKRVKRNNQLLLCEAPKGIGILPTLLCEAPNGCGYYLLIMEFHILLISFANWSPLFRMRALWIYSFAIVGFYWS